MSVTVDPLAHRALLIPEVLDSICDNLSPRERVRFGLACRGLLSAAWRAWEKARADWHVRSIVNSMKAHPASEIKDRIDIYRASIRVLILKSPSLETAKELEDQFLALRYQAEQRPLFPNLRKLTASTPVPKGVSLVSACLTRSLRCLEIEIEASGDRNAIIWATVMGPILDRLPVACPYLEELRIEQDHPASTTLLPTLLFIPRLPCLKKVSLAFAVVSALLLHELSQTKVSHLSLTGGQKVRTLQLPMEPHNPSSRWRTLQELVLKSSTRNINTILTVVNAELATLKLDLAYGDPTLPLCQLPLTIGRGFRQLQKIEFVVSPPLIGTPDGDLDLETFFALRDCQQIQEFSVEYRALKPITTRNNSLMLLTARWSMLQFFRAIWTGDQSSDDEEQAGPTFSITDIAEVTHTCPQLSTMELTLATFEEDLGWPEPISSDHHLILQLEEIVADESYLVHAVDRIWPKLELKFTHQTPYVVTAARDYSRRILETLARIQARRLARQQITGC